MTPNDRIDKLERSVAQMELVKKGIDSNTGGWDGSVLTVQGLIMASTTPANSAAPGVVGTVSWDANYVYVRTATGWKRAALSTF